MNTTVKRLIALTAAAALAAVGVNCAPVDAPGPDEGKAPAARPAAVPSPAPPPPLTGGEADGLKERIDAAIDQVRRRDLLTTNGFWTVFHGILGLGPSVQLLDPTTGRRVNALDYIADGGEVRGLHFIPTPDGVDVETQAGSFVGQGHQDQFVAEMVEWNVSPEKQFLVKGEPHPFKDFVRFSRARASVRGKQELDWAIVVISQYYGTDAAWTNAAGESLRYEDLIRYVLDAPMEDAACGGTHRLFGLSWAYHLHMLHGGKRTGVWQEVAERTAHYRDVARQLQNADGTFSTNFFRGRGASPEVSQRLATTGHILEWLSLSASDEELRSPSMRDAANALALLILDNQGAPLEGGSLYHAVHGLLIYRARVFGADGLGPNTPHEPPPPKDQLPFPVPVGG